MSWRSKSRRARVASASAFSASTSAARACARASSTTARYGRSSIWTRSCPSVTSWLSSTSTFSTWPATFALIRMIRASTKATGWRRITARGAMRAPPTRARASGTPSSMRRHLARLWSHPPEEKDQRDARQAQEGDQPEVVHVGEQRHLAKELLVEDGDGLIGGHIGPDLRRQHPTQRVEPLGVDRVLGGEILD